MINSLNLHNYFCSSYKKYRGEHYQYRGKGLEMSMLKKLLNEYDPYQIMAAIDYANESFTDINIKIFYNYAMQIIEDIAEDALVCRANYAIKKADKDLRKQIIKALERYIDESDAWFPSKRNIKKAIQELEELVEPCLN